MEEYYPSEIARLVLGYLKEVECHHAWKTFVQESSDLREYYNLYKEGKVYTTNVNGKSLIDTLREYCSFKSNAANRNSQKKCANNAFQNSEVETPDKVPENIKVVNQMVQTSSSTPACQTPKRKSKFRVTHLNFDCETECMDKSMPNDDASVDKLSCCNSPSNSLFNTNFVITDNTLSKSVMTKSVKLCDTSVQTDLNLNYKDQNVSSIGIQTENLCLCLSSLSKNSQETFQTNTKQTSCSVSDTNVINMHISSSCELSKPTVYLEQNNDSGTANACGKVEESFSSSNNKSLSEISNCDKCIEPETVLTDEMSESPVLEKFDNKASYREEIFLKRVSSSPVSNQIHQTVTATVDMSENMDVTDEDVTKDNLTLPTEDPAFEKNSYNSNQKTAEISSSDECNEKNIVRTGNSTDIQNKRISSEPDNQLHLNNEVTEFPTEVFDHLEDNKLPAHENLSLENNADGFEKNFNNQEIARSYCDLELNNSDMCTTSSSKLDVFNNELESMTSNNLTTYSEKGQDSNSEYISSELEKNQPDPKSVTCNIPSNLTSGDKIYADLPGNVEAQKASEYSNLTEYENKANSKCLSDVSPEKSKTDTVAENDFPSRDTNKEVTNIVKNKSQVKNVSSELCQSSDNNNQNTVSKLDKSEKVSVIDQIRPTVVPPLTFNNPSLLISNPSILTYQNVPSDSFFQNNGQYQYFMVLPVQTVPPVPTVPVSVTNPVLPSTGTVVMSANNLNMAKNEKAAISLSNSDKISSTVSTPSKQSIAVPSPIRSCSENSDKMPSTVNTPSKQNIVVPSTISSSSERDKNSDKMLSAVNTPSKQNVVVPSTIRSSSERDKNSDKMPSTVNTPSKQNIVVPSTISSSSESDKNSDKMPSTVNTPSKQNTVVPTTISSSSENDKSNGKPTAHLITSSPMNNKVATFEIQTPSKKRLKGQAECTTWLIMDQNSSLSSKTPKKKVKKSKKKKTKEKDLTESGIPNEKKSNKTDKQNDKQNLDKKIISCGLPSSLAVEKASLTKNVDCHSILSNFKSSSHCNLSAVFKETSEITDQDGIEKECRVLKVLVSDILKSPHVQCLDFNVDSTVDKIKKENHDKEFSGENNRAQLELQTGKIFCESSETDCSFIDKDIKISKNVTSSCRNKKRIDTFVKEINTAESILTYKTDNFEAVKNQCPISALLNVEEFNSESINSTDAIVKEITTALEDCLDDVPDSIEVVVLSDSDELNKEGETVNGQCLTADIDDLSDCQEVNQQNLNTELGSVKEAEKIKNHVNPMTIINETVDCENDPSVDMDCRKLPEALDLDNTEKNNATFQHQEVGNITGKNYEKNCEQTLADNISITKVGNNFELCTAASVDCNSEKDDLDSNRSLMINTSPFNEEENAETLENSFILSDSESVENNSLSNPVCESDHYSNVNSEELSPLSNSTIANVSLHNGTQNMPSNINAKIDSSSIHHSPKNHLVSTNLPFFKQKSNVNQVVEISTHDENDKHFQLHNHSEKKANLHLPQGIIDSVKYFNSQSKMRNHVNVKNPSNRGLNSIDKSTVECNTTTTFDPRSNSLPVIDADKCKSVAPCKISSPIVNIETARNENLNSSKIKFVQHLDSSANKELNNDMPCDDVEKATFSSNNDTKQFSSGLYDMEKFVTDIDSSHLYHSKINYSRSRTAFKKRMRHCSYDSSVSHGEAKTLSSGHIMTKSKNSKSLENITNEKLYAKTDVHKNYSSIEPVYSHNCELKASLNQDIVSKNSLNFTSDSNSHTAIILHERNSQLPIKVQQTDSHKVSAKRYLLEEDSDSDEDSALVKEKEDIADRFSNKRILLEKDAHTFQQTGKYSTKKCIFKNETLSPVRTQITPSPNVKIINTRLEEVKNQTNMDYERSKSVLGRKEPIQSVEKKLKDFNQTPSEEVSNASPEPFEIQTISEIACLDNDKDFPCRSVRYKRKSSDSLPSEGCSVVSCSDDRLTLKKNHYLGNNQVYANNSNLTKRPKLNSRSSSPEKDNLNDAFEDVSHLTLNATSVESSFITNEYPISKSIVKNIKSGVIEDSPIRCVSYKKKSVNKSALRKRLEKDPNIPPGVKIPSKWNTTKIINYSDAIGHSICDNIFSKKNVAKNKKRRSRPTLKISSIQSPSKAILSDKKKLSSKQSSLNCVPKGSTQRSTVCNKVFKNEQQQQSKKTMKKSKKLDSQENIKLNYEQTVLQNTKKKTVSSISAKPVKVQSQISDKNMLAQVSPQNNSVVNHCETTQDIVEADIGRSDESGSELANAIASVERELVNLLPDNVPESSEVTIDDEMNTMQNSDAISDNCEPEGIKQASLECVSEHSKFLMLLEKIRSMGVEKVLEKIYTLEEENK